MIYFDISKSGSSGHHSGLTRVNERLRHALGASAVPVRWRGHWEMADGETPSLSAGDWILTSELFSEAERPGFTAFLSAHPCRLAAVFHDAIPLRHPHITWPRSVERHPGYMKSLASFDRLFAVSTSSAEDLHGFWQWQGVARTPPVEVLALGADFDGSPRVGQSGSRAVRQSGSSGTTAPLPDCPTARPSLLCVGIIEPRKNQRFLIEVCRTLWRDGLEFDLHLVGRTNPHFGREIADEIKRIARHAPRLHFHGPAPDAKLAGLYARARATVLPTIAEGCGLPLLESLWRGIPCVATDLPALRENATGGGCLLLPANDSEAWQTGLRNIISDGPQYAVLQQAAQTRPLPTWSAAAAQLLSAIGGRG